MEAEAGAETVELVPVGGLAPEEARELALRLSRRVRAPCRLGPALPEMRPAMLPGRDQADADALLGRLEALPGPPGAIRVGVTDLDLAIPVFTFVFGRARQGGRAALVSLARLDPAFYGLPPDPRLRAERAVIEILHELGHLASLVHCPDGTCLMSFAGSVGRLDARGSVFCASCRERLPAWM